MLQRYLPNSRTARLSPLRFKRHEIISFHRRDFCNQFHVLRLPGPMLAPGFRAAGLHVGFVCVCFVRKRNHGSSTSGSKDLPIPVDAVWLRSNRVNTECPLPQALASISSTRRATQARDIGLAPPRFVVDPRTLLLAIVRECEVISLEPCRRRPWKSRPRPHIQLRVGFQRYVGHLRTYFSNLHRQMNSIGHCFQSSTINTISHLTLAYLLGPFCRLDLATVSASVAQRPNDLPELPTST